MVFAAVASAVSLTSASASKPWWASAPQVEDTTGATALLEAGRLEGDPLAVDFLLFDDVIESLPDEYEVQDSWDCIGHQPDSNYVFVCYTTWKNTKDRSAFADQDTLVFRVDISTQQRTFVGTFKEAAARAGNLWHGEIIPKGHTHIVHADGHMYIGSQNFHDFKFDVNVTELNSYHGSHIFSINTETLTLEDATAKHCPNGVGVDHQGIVGLSSIKELNLLAGLTHPYSDLVLFNYVTQKLERVVKGIPWSKGNPLSREIVALPNGHVYMYRGVEDPRYDSPDTDFPVWMYDHQTGDMQPTNVTMHNGMWDSHAYKKDASGVYICSCLGEVWYLDTATETWSSLGTFLPRDRLEKGVRIAALYTIALTPEEDKLYGIVSFYYPKSLPQAVIPGGDLYVMDLKTKEVSFVQFLGHGVYTGSGVTVSDSMYFAKAGELLNDYWIGNVSLGTIHFSAKSPPVVVV